ncbi:hypothetical protein YPPY54_2397, partial [Yersinia pestis PY-54]
MPRIL